MKFKITDPSNSISILIIYDCIENVQKFLNVTGCGSWTIEPVVFDIYQDLRGIGLTHDQCDQVIDLIDFKTTFNSGILI